MTVGKHAGSNPRQSTLLLPFRIATSKIAIRTYIGSLLFLTTSFLLLGLAVAAYTAFYWSYIPRIGFTRQVHLQFDHDYATIPPTSTIPSQPGMETGAVITRPETLSQHPWGTVALASDLVSQQLYDITVHLTLPRSPQNTAQGNFMLDASLLGPSPSAPLSAILNTDTPPVLARSRRSAFLTYYSREVDLARKALRLPALLTGIAQETESIDVQLFEGLEFPRGWRNVPQTLRLEIQSRERNMQIYTCSISFRARFRGLRWIMYNHRIASAVAFISAFWITEMLAMSVAWIALSLFIFPKVDEAATRSERNARGKAIKTEEEEADDDLGEQKALSDTERTFPSYAGSPVLKYQHPKTEEHDDDEHVRIKREEESAEPFPPLQPAAGEAADDEEEEDDYVLDSGLGTSLESSAGGRRESVRRRKSARMRAGS